MVQADELNVFQFIPKRQGSVIGINVMGKIFTIFFDNNPDSDYTIRGLLNYINQSPELKALDNAFNKHIMGHPTDRVHQISHPCDDRLQHNHHIHCAYQKIITPAFIDLFVDAMQAFEKSPELRAKYCVKPTVVQAIDFLSGAGLSSYNASKPLRYMFNDEKKLLQRDFRRLFDEGLMEPPARACSSEPVLYQYLNTPMLKQCLPNDARYALPQWIPASKEAHQQDLDTVRQIDNTFGRMRTGIGYFQSLSSALLIAYFIVRCCSAHPERRERRPHMQ